MSNPRRTPSLADIAASAGVSIATASRALQGRSPLRSETVRKVQDAARTLGYKRNPLVSHLMRRMRYANGARAVRGVIAYLTFGATRNSWRKHLTYVGFFEGARRRAEELNFCLEEVWANQPDIGPKRLGAILKARNIVGVLIGPTAGLPKPPLLDWADFAPVKVGVPIPDLPMPSAGSNHYFAMRQVLKELNEFGYRRLGLVLQSHQDIKTSSMWLTPFMFSEQQKRAVDRVPPLILSEWKQTDFSSWFQRHQPEVIIGLRSELIEWMKALGKRVPGDVGFVHLDRGTESGNYAGIDQHTREIGAAAVDLAISRLIANERGLIPRQHLFMIEGEWVDGPTLRETRSNRA